MPRFDFTCRDCNTTFEGSIAFGSKEYPPCPACQSSNIDKLLAKPLGIVFKGKGFYKTDSSTTPESPAPGSPQPEKTAEKPAKAPDPPSSNN